MVRLLAHFLLTCIVVAFASSVSLRAQTTIYWKKDYIRDSSGSTIAVATPAPSDTTAPTDPGTPTATVATTSVALSWAASTDNTTVTGYLVYRGPIPVAAVSGLAFTDVGLLPYTAYSYRIVAFDAAHNYSGYSSPLNVTTSANSGAPLGLTATASSTTQVNLTWSVPGSGAPDHYRVLRRSGGSWASVGTTSSLSYSDTTVSVSTAYLYRIAAENSSNVVQGYTNVDLATTVIFTDDTITVASTLIKAAHVTELRTAVNAVRTAAGLGSATWTNSSLSGAWIKAVDISELRVSLGDAINLLGLTAPNYTDTNLTPVGVTRVAVKKAHIEELRQRVK